MSDTQPIPTLNSMSVMIEECRSKLKDNNDARLELKLREQLYAAIVDYRRRSTEYDKNKDKINNLLALFKGVVADGPNFNRIIQYCINLLEQVKGQRMRLDHKLEGAKERAMNIYAQQFEAARIDTENIKIQCHEVGDALAYWLRTEVLSEGVERLPDRTPIDKREIKSVVLALLWPIITMDADLKK